MIILQQSFQNQTIFQEHMLPFDTKKLNILYKIDTTTDQNRAFLASLKIYSNLAP